jgi:hypothetical protein
MGFRIDTNTYCLTNPLDDRARGPCWPLFSSCYSSRYGLGSSSSKRKIGEDVGVWYIPSTHVKLDLREFACFRSGFSALKLSRIYFNYSRWDRDTIGHRITTNNSIASGQRTITNAKRTASFSIDRTVPVVHNFYTQNHLTGYLFKVHLN